MEFGIFKKIELISKSGFLASSLLNTWAMNNKTKDNNKSFIGNDNKINNINLTNNENSVNLTNNLGINSINKQEIKDEQILELFKKSLNTTLDEYINYCKKTHFSQNYEKNDDFFHNFIILSKILNTNSYEKESVYDKIKGFHRILHEKDFLNNYKKLSNSDEIFKFSNISNFGIFKYKSTIKNFDQSSYNYCMFKKNNEPEELFDCSGCWEENFFENKFNENLDNLSNNIINEINSLIKEIIRKDFRISNRIYNSDCLISKEISKKNKINKGEYLEIDKEEKEYLKKIKNYYFIFYSINFIIDYFKNNFPNIYNFHKLFLKKAKLNKFSIKDANEYECNSFDGKCNVFTKNKEKEYVPFSIYLNTKNILEKDSNLEIFTTVVHEFCHFIINTFSYTILKECEIDYKPSEANQLCIDESNHFPKLKKLQYVLFSKLMDILKDKKQFKDFLVEEGSSCYLSDSYNNKNYLELLTCCLSDYIMNGVFDNINKFIENAINNKKDNEDNKNLKTEFFFDKDKIHEEITFSFSNKEIINFSTEIGENLFKILKNYDNILTEDKVDEILKDVEILKIEVDKTNYIRESDLKD